MCRVGPEAGTPAPHTSPHLGGRGSDHLPLPEAMSPAPSSGGFSVFFRKLTYGTHPVDVAEEVMRTVRRKKQEVFLANPIPKAAVYIRTLFPELFFAVVACGVKEKLSVPEEG